MLSRSHYIWHGWCIPCSDSVWISMAIGQFWKDNSLSTTYNSYSTVAMNIFGPSIQQSLIIYSLLWVTDLYLISLVGMMGHGEDKSPARNAACQSVPNPHPECHAYRRMPPRSMQMRYKTRNPKIPNKCNTRSQPNLGCFRHLTLHARHLSLN